MEHDPKMWAVRCLQAIPTVFLSEYRHEFYSCSLKITGTTGPVDQFVVHIVNNFRNEGVVFMHSSCYLSFSHSLSICLFQPLPISHTDSLAPITLLYIPLEPFPHPDSLPPLPSLAQIGWLLIAYSPITSSHSHHLSSYTGSSLFTQYHSVSCHW